MYYYYYTILNAFNCALPLRKVQPYMFFNVYIVHK